MNRGKGTWETVFKGSLIAVQKNSENGFERAIRTPGVRLILKDSAGRILLTKEFRPEHDKYDFRLPGGKVFGSLEDYLVVRGNVKAITEAVMGAARTEAKEEAGVEEIGDLTLFSRSVAGTTIEWDLYYLTGKALKMGEPDLHDDEVQDLEGASFYSPDEVLRMLKSQEISEDRTAAVLYRYLQA